jgi:PAS domain S-box-containing protein
MKKLSITGLIFYACQANSTPAFGMPGSLHGETGVIFGIAGMLQLCVAIYAIRLNRLFGMARVGWSLFWAFFLMALLHLVQSTNQSVATTPLQVNLEVIYTLISLLLLTGMAHLHAVLREQIQRKREEQRMRAELEIEVQKQTAHLANVIEELKSEIDERKRAEQQVREQARLLDLTHDAILVQDLEGRIQYWNKGAEGVYGWTAPEAKGKKTSQLLGLELMAYDQASQIVRKKGRWQGEASVRARNGQDVLVESDWTLVCDAQGIPVSVMVISADITEKRKLEIQTLRSQRLESIGTLASGIAHDLNNVLTPLLISVQLLKAKITSDSEQELLETMRVNVLRGARLVKQILAFGRGVKGDRAVVKPVLVAQEIKQIIHDTFPKSLEFEIQADEELWTLIGDATQLHQVMLNLCLNARDAMPDGGKLSIYMNNVVIDEHYAGSHPEARAGQYVLIKVTDTGEGIPKEIQSKIFEPFFTTKAHGKGTGLGLSTCFTIVKSHGGFINAYSELGKGSAFKVYLPANTTLTATEGQTTKPPTLPRGQGELVLVVDDEEAIRDFAQLTLEHFGYRTLTASNGAEAVALYRTHQNEIAVILTDMAMPVMDGPAEIAALKSINREVRIIGMSGLDPVGGEETTSGMVHFIPKPYSTEVLLHTLHGVLHAMPVATVPVLANASASLSGRSFAFAGEQAARN